MCLFTGIVNSHSHENTDDISIENLKFIDISSDSILSSILNDATDKIKYGSRPSYYSVCFNRYKRGTMIRIIRSRKDIFDKRSNILGYTMVNDSPIVFYEGVSKYKFKYISTPNQHPIKLGHFNYIEDAEEVKYYYILGNIFARFSPEVGWIWSDGKPDE